MTILISERDWTEWNEELQHLIEYPDPDDRRDLLLPQPAWFAQGYTREISLHDGLMVQIYNFQVCDRTEQVFSEGEEWIAFHCHLSGDHQDARTEVGNLEYALYGSGLYFKQVVCCSGQSPILEVIVHMAPEVLLGFIGEQGELPPELQHLLAASLQPGYTRVGALSPTMQRVLWQIIHCPYRGLMKRMYLESKALELGALILEQEQDLQQEQRSPRYFTADQIERIHYARTILLKNLKHPPSLLELARQVELNDYALKRGFRQVFGKSVFAYLHDYRMEQARQLLMAGNFKVGEVMQQVGLRDRKSFATAFRKKFRVNPRDYLHFKP
jgi:AraC-like DNA-binding protein